MDSVNQVLQAGPVSPAARQALESELALHDTMEGYIWAMRSERAFTLSSTAGNSRHRLLADAGLRRTT